MSTLEDALMRRRKQLEDKLYALNVRGRMLELKIERIDRAIDALRGEPEPTGSALGYSSPDRDG